MRDLAVDVVGLLLDIVSKYQGYSRQYEHDTIASLEGLKKHLGSGDAVPALTSLVDILNAKIPTSDMWTFLESLVDGLLDSFATSSSGLSLIMCILLKVCNQLDNNWPFGWFDFYRFPFISINFTQLTQFYSLNYINLNWLTWFDQLDVIYFD